MSNHLNDTGYARCKACDKRFYPQWNKKSKDFEELCWKCLPIAIYAAKTDSVLFGLDADGNPNWSPDTWVAKEDQSFVNGFMQDKIDTAHGDLWLEDEYLMHGEGAMGDLGIFDSYE